MIEMRGLTRLMVVLALVLSLGAVLAPQAQANLVEKYLDITGGEVLWCQSTGDDTDMETWIKIIDDLDGDGQPDVLVETEVGPDDNRTCTVIVKKGSDGSHLWEESVTGEDAWMGVDFVDDLDGDGVPDFLVRTHVGHYTDRTFEVIAKKGSDGTHLWQQSMSGHDPWMDAEVVDDLDGDGLPDVLVETRVGPTDNKTRGVIAKKGSDGTHFWEESITGYRAEMWPEVVDDLDGDGKPDILVEARKGPDDDLTSKVIAKKGNDGTHFWEESTTGDHAYIYGQGVDDLNGDGLADVIVSSRIGPDSGRTYEMIAKIGFNGTHLWEESINGENAYMWVNRVDDFDGDGMADVLVKTEVGSASDGTSKLIAKIGISGTHLWEVSVNGVWAYLSVAGVDDFDGDGLPDFLINRRVSSGSDKLGEMIAKKGSNGTTLWQESVIGNNALIWVRAIDDFDGDGKPDVLVQTEVGPDSDKTYELIAKKGYNGTHFWEESINGDHASMWGEVAGDLDGDGNPDFVVWTRVGPDSDRTAEVIAKKGNDGTHFWQESITGENAYIGGEGVDDLDGDGLADVLVETSVGPNDNKTEELIAKKGYNGDHFWEESITGENAWISADTVDDLDGDGKADILVRSSVGPSDNKTREVIAKKGSDGTHFWEESITGENADITTTVIGDLDCDGKPDVLVETRVGPTSDKTSEVIAKKGSDGTHFWEAESNDEIRLGYLPPAPGEYEGELGYDLDDDGKEDIVLGISNKVCAIGPGGPPCEVPLPAVGGEVYPVNKVSVLAPWFGLILILAIGGGIFALRRRRAH